jgi:accessory gene regulator B
MYLSEKIAATMATKISDSLNLENDQKEIISYGAFMLIQTILSIIVTIISGLSFEVLTEIMAIAIISSILRKNSGGAHASSPGMCIILGTITFTILALLVQYILIIDINIIIALSIIVLIFSYYTVIKKCPVAAPTKPIKNIEKRKKLKIKTINTLHLYFITCFILSYFYFSLSNLLFLKLIICIVLGVFWQTVTLTNFGGNAMHTIDDFFKIFTKEGGEVK